MIRVTSLTNLNDQQLNRWIKRVLLLLVVGTVAFAAFYVFDRYRAPTTPIVDQRIAALEQAVRDKPDDIASRGQLADTYKAKGRFQDAITQYNAILETDKQTELATYGRAGAYLGLEQYDDAAKDYKAVVAIAKAGEMANVDPMLEASYYFLGSIAMKQDKPSEAIGYLEAALAITRSDADALYLVGTAYTATGATDKAVAALRGSIAFDPIGSADPYTALVDAYTRAGNAAEAEWAAAMVDVVGQEAGDAKSRLEALVGGPASVDAMIGLGLLFEKNGDTGSASDWYQKALAADPTNAPARLGLGRVGGHDAASPLPALPTPGVPGGNG